MKKLLVISLCFTFLGCNTVEKTVKEATVLEDLQTEAKEEELTHYLYDIGTRGIPRKRVFKLSDRIYGKLLISNLGTKALILPKELVYSDEYTLETYRKQDNTDLFKLYQQKRKIMIQHSCFNFVDIKRELTSTKNGNGITYDNMPLYHNRPIVDEGVYKTVYAIDLSKYGYFKEFKATTVFEVVSDSSEQTEPSYPPKLDDINIDYMRIKEKTKAIERGHIKLGDAKKDSIN